MDLFQLMVKDTMHFVSGLLGVSFIYVIASTINELVEGLVNWVGNKIDSLRQIKTR